MPTVSHWVWVVNVIRDSKYFVCRDLRKISTGKKEKTNAVLLRSRKKGAPQIMGKRH